MPGGVACAHPVLNISPRAARTELARWRPDGLLHLRRAAQLVNGAANAAALAFLTTRLNIARQRIQLVRGDTASIKLV
ncbi:MAG: DUF167 domain-containing protein, partial [Chloroflexi bacterium]